MHRDLEKTEQSLGERIFAGDGALPPSVNSKYEVLGPLGIGGMAVVYKARHRVTDQLVALKVLKQQDDIALARFMQEAKTETSLSHPNIVAVHDFDIVDSTAYLVMELIEGPTLADVLREEKTISLDRFVRLMDDVCQGLAYAHDKGIVHRDIKPSNILLKKEGEREVAKIADFGIAKAAEDVAQNLTQTGEILGTPLYMSPEQCMGQAASKLSDIYALGCVMYKALTGMVPLAGSNLMETAHVRATQTPKSFAELKVQGIPRHIEAAIFGCLERDVTARTSDLMVVANQIRGKRVFKPIRVRPHWFKWLVRSIAAICVVITLLVVGLVALTIKVANDHGIPLKFEFSVLTPSRSFEHHANTLAEAGEIAYETGNYAGAMKSFKLLEESARKKKSLKWEAYALSEEAQVEFRQDNIDAAVAKLRKSTELATQLHAGKGPALARWHTSAAQLLISMRRYSDAEESMKQASRLIAHVRGAERERELSRLVSTYKVYCERTGVTPDVPALIRAIDQMAPKTR